MEHTSPRYLIAGRIAREYVILPSEKAVLDVPGGNALYAGIGAAIWEPQPPIAIVSRVGEDYPQEWLDSFNQRCLDTRGVRVLPQPIDVRSFLAYTSRSQRSTEDPVALFARLEMPFPKALLGYRTNNTPLDSRTQLQLTSLRQGDIPGRFSGCQRRPFMPGRLPHSQPAARRPAPGGIHHRDPGPVSRLYESDLLG